MFSATNTVKNSDKEKWVYSGYWIAFHGAGSWNENVTNVILSVVANSSSVYADNHKNDYLILGQGSTYGINGSLGALEKKFNINFRKAKTKFFSRLH